MSIPLRVLIVEDSQADAELTLAELRYGGYDPIYERVDTPEAMKAALEKGKWDIILSDYVMPRFSGPAALKLVQQMGMDLPFIVVTGQVGEATAIETLTAGTHDYVMKGNMARLVPAVQRVLQDAVLRRERREADEALRRAHEELRLAHAELEKRVEERTAELAAERERLAITLRSIGDGVIATDTQGNVTLMNEVAEELSGWTEEDAAGRPLADVFHIVNEQSRAPFENPVARVLKTGTIVELANNTVLVTRDGTERIIADSAAPVRSEDGRTVGVVLVFRDVTERKRAEQERETLLREVEHLVAQLSEERARLRAVIDNAPEGIIVSDEKTRVLLANPAAERLYARPVPYGEEVDSHAAPQLVHPDGTPYDPYDLPLTRSALRGEILTKVEMAIVWPDGQRRDLLVNTAPIRDGEGNITGAVGVFQDITEAKQAAEERERLLREIDERRRRFETVVENAPVGIAVLRGPEFVFELANPVYQAIAPGKVLIGRTVAQAWQELASQVLPLLELVYRTGEPYRTTDAPFPVQRSPGGPIEEVYFTFAYIPLIGADGHVDAILVLVIETTDQVRARQRTEQLSRDAQRRSAELQGIIDNMVDGVFVSDAKGRITLVNESGVKMLGMDKPEEAKRLLAEFPELLRTRHLNGDPVGPEELPLSRSLRGETVVGDNEVILNPKTQRDTYLRVSTAPIRDEEGKIAGAVAVTRDVTEEIEFDLMKDQFISVAAHELKTPVAIMKAHAQALLRTVTNIPAPRRKMLEAINRGSDRIDRIVGDLLDISRLLAGHLELSIESIDLPQMVEDVVDRMALTTTKHHIRVVRMEPVVVRGDRDRLEQVLINLIDNAIKYSPKGGDIEVAVDVSDHEAVVSVRDMGVGIPKDRQKRIFERFYRAHTGTPYDYGGMGVGLFISREIINRHGGSMWFESEEGKGSKFYFSLPPRGENAGR